MPSPTGCPTGTSRTRSTRGRTTTATTPSSRGTANWSTATSGYCKLSNPDVALHYWDWTEDPRAASDGQGGTVDLSLTRACSGPFSGTLNGALASVHNGGVLAGSRRADSGTRPTRRSPWSGAAGTGAPGLASDSSTMASSNGVGHRCNSGRRSGWLWSSAHNSAHGYIGGDIGGQHQAFEDPFVFLLHSNVDRCSPCGRRSWGGVAAGSRPGLRRPGRDRRGRRHPTASAAVGRHRGLRLPDRAVGGRLAGDRSQGLPASVGLVTPALYDTLPLTVDPGQPRPRRTRSVSSI